MDLRNVKNILLPNGEYAKSFYNSSQLLWSKEKIEITEEEKEIRLGQILNVYYASKLSPTTGIITNGTVNIEDGRYGSLEKQITVEENKVIKMMPGDIEGAPQNPPNHIYKIDPNQSSANVSSAGKGIFYFAYDDDYIYIAIKQVAQKNKDMVRCNYGFSFGFDIHDMYNFIYFPTSAGRWIDSENINKNLRVTHGRLGNIHILQKNDGRPYDLASYFFDNNTHVYKERAANEQGYIEDINVQNLNDFTIIIEFKINKYWALSIYNQYARYTKPSGLYSPKLTSLDGMWFKMAADARIGAKADSAGQFQYLVTDIREKKKNLQDMNFLKEYGYVSENQNSHWNRYGDLEVLPSLVLFKDPPTTV